MSSNTAQIQRSHPGGTRKNNPGRVHVFGSRTTRARIRQDRDSQTSLGRSETTGNGGTPSAASETVAEERLITLCREGDAEACALLLKKYAALIYSVPLHQFGMSQDDADDIYQMCFVRVLKRARQFRGDSRFSAWLRTVVRNICVDCIRSQKSAVSLDAVREGCESCPLCTVCSADAFVKQAEERSILEEALSQLPDHYRNPLRLFFFEEKSYREISEILNEPVNTVGTHINRGLARLRKVLGGDMDTVQALLS